MVEEEVFRAHGFDVTSEQARKLNEHYHDPKNRWALKDYNARGIGRNPSNYGQVDLYLLVDDEDKIKDIGYEFNGCPTIAFTASIYTEELKGLPMEEAFAITQSSLEEMAAQNNCEECTQMVLLAFLGAYENYQNRKNDKKEEFALKTMQPNPAFSQQTCG
ncbi:MAG: iron-sulfur cluster assembly scaffold protein [Sulfurovum sp.]|nr:iron-sulfur cluster assembly scaffold protein [Sulfurovum sp.]MDD3602798.1 iron-sulfur cluster assembly scaffold protein [Sulfurovum sp.]